MKLTVGDKAPDFTLPDQEGKVHSLSDYRGKWVLLYFYPKDNTPGCTIEAHRIRDNWEKFKQNNAVALGVSTDDVKSHGQFAKDHFLPFPILADEKKEVVKLYDVWGERVFLGEKGVGTKRISFLIDPSGNIAKIYEKVEPDVHAEEVLADITKA